MKTSSSTHKVAVTYLGGPKNGSTGRAPVTVASQLRKPPKLFSCATDARAKGMYGIYVLDENIASEPYRYVWKTTRTA